MESLSNKNNIRILLIYLSMYISDMICKQTKQKRMNLVYSLDHIRTISHFSSREDVVTLVPEK